MRSLALVVASISALVARPARADETDATRLSGPAAHDYAIRLDCGWDVIARDANELVARLPPPPGKPSCESYDAAVSPDEKWLATSMGLWSLRRRRWVTPLPDGWGFTFSPDGRYLAYVDHPLPSSPDEIYHRRGRVVVIDLRAGTTRASQRVLGPLSNGRPLSFVGGTPPAVLVTDYALTLFALPSLRAKPVAWSDLGHLVRAEAPGGS